MERLSIDEVMAHCRRTCEHTEMLAIAQGKTQDDITSNNYWEHYQVEEWLKELKAYRDAEEQGLLIKLPCKVGDRVWCIFEGKVYKAIARKVTIVTGTDNYQLVKIEAEFYIVDPFYNDGRFRKYGVYQNIYFLLQ